MIDIANATLCWRSDKVWVTAGDVGPVGGASAQPIGDLTQAMAAAWMCASDGYAVPAIHEALMGLDRYAAVYREP